MGFFGSYTAPGPGVPKDAPPKRGPALLFSVLGREFFGLVKLNLLCLLFCIPLLTIPAALTAACRVALTMLRDENHFLWRDFRASFKREFWPSTLVGLPFGLLLAACGAGARAFAAAVPSAPAVFLPLLLLAGAGLLTLLCAALYLFPMLARIDLPPLRILRNALLLAFLCLPRNLLALAAIGALDLLSARLLPVSLLYLPLLGVSLPCLIGCFCARGGIQKYVLQERGE